MLLVAAALPRQGPIDACGRGPRGRTGARRLSTRAVIAPKSVRGHRPIGVRMTSHAVADSFVERGSTSELARLLRGEGLRAVYQPIVDLASGDSNHDPAGPRARDSYATTSPLARSTMGW